MATEPRFNLTTRDHAILEALLDAYGGPRGPWVQLLEQKLRASAIAFSGDIAADVVTLGSRVAYRVDGKAAGPHKLAESEAAAAVPDEISIHTLRGLALLGLAEGDAVIVGLGEGASEQLVVDKVLSQPEAEARRRVPAPGPSLAADAGDGSTVVSFRPRPAGRQGFPGPGPGPAPGPDDDDPGPRAA